MTLTRRSILGGLMAGLPAGWVGGAYAAEGPETKQVRFGIIALTDCSSIVMAHELGLFKKYGIDSIVSKEASWAVIRDKLSLGENQATHMLLGYAVRVHHGVERISGEAHGNSMATQPERAGHYAEQEAEGFGRERPQGSQATCGQGTHDREPDDIRDDVSAGHARDVDALLARIGRCAS